MSSFKVALEKARTGDNTAMEQIIKMVMPMINKKSTVKGRIDEELKAILITEVKEVQSRKIGREYRISKVNIITYLLK